MNRFPVEGVRAAMRLEPMRWSLCGGGFTPAGRWLVEFENGSAGFVKAAQGIDAEAIRRDIVVLSALSGSFHPQLLGWHDDDDLVVEVLEDLSAARWPPPYPANIDSAFAALDLVADHAVPNGLPSLTIPAERRWPTIANDPQPLLDLNVCTAQWLDRALEHLVGAEASFDPVGNRLVHNDIWAGNVAFVDGRCVLIDWSEAHRGSRWVDVGFLTLSLRSEAGPGTTERFPGDAGFVGWWSADLACRLLGGLEPWIDTSILPGLHQDLVAALAWASELFDLPAPTT
jgi:hypothetical protein